MCDICRLQTGRLYIVLPIRIYTIYTYTYIPIPIRSASLANRSSSLANPSASLQVCSLHLSHTGRVNVGGNSVCANEAKHPATCTTMFPLFLTFLLKAFIKKAHLKGRKPRHIPQNTMRRARHSHHPRNHCYPEEHSRCDCFSHLKVFQKSHRWNLDEFYAFLLRYY